MNNTIPNDKPLFPISVIADMLQVHQRTLRIYNDEGILVPQRSPKNRRLYSLDDIERGKFIQYLTRNIGVNIAGVKIIFILLGKNYNPATQKEEIEKIANDLGITTEQQEETKEKLSRRGRKPSNGR